MFGLFKNKKKQLSGVELVEEGLKQVAIAIKNNTIDIEQGKIYRDIYVHADSPTGLPRITYIMFSPTIPNQVIARCVIYLDRVQSGIPIWQIDWVVLAEYRNKKFGSTVAQKALMEFISGMSGNLESGIYIEAIVDEDNEASKKIARALIGGEKIIVNKTTNANVHSFLKQFNT